jgi:2-dehydropantoate 2-reductase
MNPLSVITGATSDKLLDDPLVRAYCVSIMQEAAQIGIAIGCPITQLANDRIQVTRQLGSFKTSMLQDAEAGKQLELDALIGVVHELGKHLQIPIPAIDSLFGLARVYGRNHRLYPG